MCMNCGCGATNDTHGDERNISQDNLDWAAEAAGIRRVQDIENTLSCPEPQDAADVRQQQPSEQECATKSGSDSAEKTP